MILRMLAISRERENIVLIHNLEEEFLLFLNDSDYLSRIRSMWNRVILNFTLFSTALSRVITYLFFLSSKVHAPMFWLHISQIWKLKEECVKISLEKIKWKSFTLEHLIWSRLTITKYTLTLFTPSL